MKKFLIAISLLGILFIAAGYFIGDYFVTFALKRENNQPPQATANIADPDLKPPARPNFDSEIWTIQSADNLNLHATYFLPSNTSHRWAVLVHGYGREQTFAFDYAEEYLKHGYNVLTPDLRASGTSEGIFLTMGALESQDIKIWCEKIIERDPQAEIILHGVSMGAATVLMASALDIKNLRAVVEDCGYTSAYEMFSAQLEKIFGLPEFPIMNIVDIVSKIKTGVAISDAAPILSVPNTKVPTLFIHGDADKLVPFEMLDKLYNASNAPVKEKFVVEGAGHADSKIKDPPKYFERVFNFIDRF
ncbi:MAG: alpha/beta hydrolase [Selenomonadaceae bacterium]|nr:alpha/beta hydrolase [Selenomonadaceae bacterium]